MMPILYRQGMSGVEYVVQESTPLYQLYGINDLITLAKKIKKDPTSFVSVNKASNNISVTNDDKFYQSDLISVVASTGFGLEQSLETKLQNDGFKPQTYEAINILKMYKTPFIVVANKIDMILSTITYGDNNDDN